MTTVWVCGSANMDLIATAARFPVPGETLPAKHFVALPGGKGLNQAVAAARYGATCRFIACVGADAFGEDLRRFVGAEGIDVTRIRCSERLPSGCALITSAGGENTIVVTAGANGDLRAEDVVQIDCQAGDVLLAQLETPVEVSRAFFGRGREAGARNILSFAPAIKSGRTLIALADVLVLNETELVALTGVDSAAVARPDQPRQVLATLGLGNEQSLVVTLGARGCVAVCPEGVHTIPGYAVEVRDSVGAGDCFAGVLAAELARGARLSTALHTANLAASLSVQRAGAASSMPRIEETRGRS